jgi:hypothetical protein
MRAADQTPTLLSTMIVSPLTNLHTSLLPGCPARFRWVLDHSERRLLRMKPMKSLPRRVSRS